MIGDYHAPFYLSQREPVLNARSERFRRRRELHRKLGDLAPKFSLAIEFGKTTEDRFYRAFPFKRNFATILIAGGMLAVFLVPLFNMLQSLPESDGDLFSLVFIAFTLFWMLGWSVGVLAIAALFLGFAFGRETLHVQNDRLVLRIGIPGFGAGMDFSAALIRNFRVAAPDEEAGSGWRGEHLVFDYGGEDVAFGCNIAGAEAEELIDTLQTLFPEHDQAVADIPPLTDIPAVEPATARLAPDVAERAQSDVATLSWRSPSALALIAANLIPVVGVLFWHWNIGELMLLFWAESAVIGFYTLLKMARVGKWAVLFYGPFFTGHYGGFMAGHLLFIYGFFVQGQMDNTDIPVQEVVANFVAMAPALLGFFISHGVSFVSNFIGRREYVGKEIGAQMGEPYKRIIIMHVTIIFGGFLVMAFGSALPALLLLVALKLAADLRAHLREHGPVKVTE